jgi:nicotinate-nucleotide adenylyltransferase
MGRRVAIFGGTFNPVHLGHLVAAQDAHELTGMDRTIWIPVAEPPHKRSPDLACGEDRLRMLELALEGDDRFATSDVEIRRAGPSYSIDTVRALQQKMPGAEMHFFIGSDSLADLHTWREIGALLDLCRFVTVTRPGFDPGTMTPHWLRLPEEACVSLRESLVDAHPVSISSSEVRERVARGASIRYLVPSAVARWIGERGLYRRKGGDRDQR